MMSLTFGLFTQVSGSGPLGPLVANYVTRPWFIAYRVFRIYLGWSIGRWCCSFQCRGILLIEQPVNFRRSKIYGNLYNQSSSIAFDETSSYWSEPKSS